MSKVVQMFSVANASYDDYIGEARQLVLNTADLTRASLHDGVTAGGHPIMFGEQNLSELTDVATARTNLGLGSAAVEDTSYWLLASNNLSDVATPATARNNLGLGSAATYDVGSGNNLDADKWDGYDFSDYLDQDVKTSATPSFTGLGLTGNITATADELDIFVSSGTGTAALAITDDGLTRAGNTVWDSANDGAGSGLVADLLDGYDTTASGARFGCIPITSSAGVTYVGSSIDFYSSDTATTTSAYIIGNSSGLISSVGFEAIGAICSIMTQDSANYGVMYGGDTQHGVVFRGYYSDYNFTVVPYNRTMFYEYGGTWIFQQIQSGATYKQIAQIDTTGITWEGNTVWHEGNDGSDSGLDADTVDGIEASAFGLLASSNTWASSQTIDGELHVTSGIYSTITSGVTHGYFSSTGMDSGIYIGAHCTDYNRTLSSNGTDFTDYNGYWYFHKIHTGSLFTELARIDGNGIYYNGNEVWHTGNDGTGSGLDADTVDGIEAAAFAKFASANSWTAEQTFYSYIVLNQLTTAGTSYVGVLDGISDEHAHSVVFRGYISDTSGTLVDSNVTSFYEYGGKWTFNKYNGLVNSNILTVSEDTFTYNSNEVWHAGNDGSGSGLDADTVDGVELSGLLQTSIPHVTSYYNNTSAGYRVWSDGYKECWSTGTATANDSTSVTYPISFSSWSHAFVDGGVESTSSEDNGPFVASTTTTGATIYNGLNQAVSIVWKAWGY